MMMMMLVDWLFHVRGSSVLLPVTLVGHVAPRRRGKTVTHAGMHAHIVSARVCREAACGCVSPIDGLLVLVGASGLTGGNEQTEQHVCGCLVF